MNSGDKSPPASAGTSPIPESEMGSGATVEILKNGRRDERFESVKKLGKDGCGY